MDAMAFGKSALAACFIVPVSAFAQDSEFFEKKVRPVLAAKCQACHNPQVKTAGLDLSSAEGFAHGGQSGPLTSADQPQSSLLLKVISYEERLKMPPTGKLSLEEITALTDWVKSGAKWPGAAAAAVVKRSQSRAFTEEEKRWWAFQPFGSVQPPVVSNAAWIATPVDRFVLAKLQERGLRPAPPADKLTLLRRVTFDLTGLPPTEEEIAAFVADNSADAWRKVIDRLLASPRYGERWGRHWLDLARYADSTGNDEDHRYPYAWRYRDYVIDAFNNDLPYDQFVREQIAGDLLPAPSGGVNRKGIIATGFLALGAKAIAQQDKKKMLYDVYDEQVDVAAKTFLGLTVSCARCHDHKFDPILTRDYYSMVAFFANTRSFKDSDSHVSKLLFRPLVSPEEYGKYQAHQDRIGAVRIEIEDVVEREKERHNATNAPRLADYMIAARSVYVDNLPAEKVALEKGLDKALIEKWAKYLKPEPGKIRIYLNEWHTAAPDRLRAVGLLYQARYQQRLGEWSKRISQWRERSRKMLAEGNMPPPPKPEFDSDQDGFFADVYIQNGGPFALSQRDQERLFTPESRARIAALRAEQEALQKSAPPEPDMACAVEEGDPVKQHVFIRGDYGSLGEEAPPGFPTILTRAGDPVPTDTGSGRIALADWIASEKNPLTARVMANRIWQWHFGEGLTRTPDNFGKMGERPTHPELLDWLAQEFVAKGWSIKSLHREILLSSAYRMSSEASKDALAKDPENRLFSRFQRRRLDVEEIRDALLAVDGSIDFTMGGSIQSGFGTDGENSDKRLSIKPEDYTRRTVYLPLRRANLPALLNLYDFGDATTTNGKRVRTNIAPQALFMLNSDFLTQRTRRLAESALKADSQTPAQRLERAYLRTVNRKPGAEETDAALTYISNFQSKFAASELDAWQSFYRVLLASNDFIYVD